MLGFLRQRQPNEMDSTLLQRHHIVPRLPDGLAAIIERGSPP
jgi:hypothetical protein